MSDGIVIDTHVLLWWLAGSERLTARAREVIAEAPQIAVEAGCLSDFHGDPADRLIYATASILKLALLTKDDKIRAFAKLHPGTRVIW